MAGILASGAADDPSEWPSFGMVDDVRPALAAARAAGRPSVLATLHAAEGGAPRGVGTQMLFVDAAPTGYLAGGCIEADVALHARAVLEDGSPRRLVYGSGGPADLPLPCGSRIEVLVERLAADDDAVGRLLGLTEARRPALWVSDGRERTCRPADAPAAPAAASAIARRYEPARRLVVVGAEPIALAVAALAVSGGWDVVLARPKGPAVPPPVAGVRYLVDEPAAALAAAGLDPWRAVALLTHDSELDHAALMTALPSAAFYVGVLGSRRRLPDRLARLRAAGLDEAAIKRLHAPIGVDLKAKAPWEIALAIVSEVVRAASEQRQSRSEPGTAATVEAA